MSRLKSNLSKLGCLDSFSKNYFFKIHFRYSHKDNLLMNESAEDAVFQSVQNFKKAGGGCLVENSTFGLNRRTGFLKQLSEDTGVHIVAGTGHYVADAQKDETLKRTIEEMTQHIVDELTVGAVDCPEVKCGFIGEIGCQYPVMGKILKM